MTPSNDNLRSFDDSICSLAAAFVIDALDKNERAAFEAHLASGCATCEKEVQLSRQAAAALALTAEPSTPNREIRDKLQRAMQATKDPRPKGAGAIVYQAKGVLVSRPSEMAWQSGPLPGMSRKVLFEDTGRGYTTALVRLEAGTHYPSHRHAGVEELYLLDGDLCLRDIVMQAGDYCRADAGSVHEEVHTKAGCMFVVTACHHDEILTAA